VSRLLLLLLAGATLAVAPAASVQGAATPTCFGKPASIVGHGAIKGTAHADVIVGGRGVDRINAGGGNDLVCAGGGADLIEGGVGSDRVDAGPGDDEVVGDNGSDTVLGDAGSDTVIGKRGNDRLFGGPGARDFLDSGLGDDTLDGGPGGLDQVIGGVGNDRLSGGAGDGDLLRPDFGRDTVAGGAGAHDTASFAVSGQNSVVFGAGGVLVDLAAGKAEGDGEDTLAGIEDVIGTPFGDTISGGVGPNELYGAGGIDDLVGAGPDDVAHGGIGLDRCRGFAAQDSCELPGVTPYSATGEVIFFEYSQGGRPPPAQQPTLEVDLAGGAAAGSLTAVVSKPGILEGTPGVEIVVGFAEGAWLLSARGAAIGVGDSCQALSPEAARCPLSGAPEAVLLSGSGGADVLRLDRSVPDTVSAFISGFKGADTLEGGAGDDSLDGYLSSDRDVLRGGGGDDALTAGASLEGGPGSDLLIAYACLGEAVEGGPGVDNVSFARSDQGVEAQIGGIAEFVGEPGGFGKGCPGGPGSLGSTTIGTTVESIEGSANDDVLRGNGARNILLGRSGDDEVHGGGGDDFLVGGLGRDSLFGGGGEDRIYASDEAADKELDCGGGRNGDVASRDSSDPRARNCRDLRAKRR
jgi:Ca2+-binding RTX toxin-like protein